MNERRILTHNDAYELLAHFVATAELHMTEGGHYTDKRILEGCLPLTDAMAQAVEPDSVTWLETFKSDIKEALANRSSHPDDYAEFLRDAAGRIVREIKRRQDEIE